MILLLAACTVYETTTREAVEPGSAAVFIDARTVVWIPKEATEEPVSITLTVEEAGGTLDAIDAFAEIRTLHHARRLYRLEFDIEDLAAPVWVGRWDDEKVRKDVAGTLFTVMQTDDGWEANGHNQEPWEEIDPVLLHPDRAWFPTQQVQFLHGTAGTESR